MKRSLRAKILTEYPDWHQQPLRLTSQEIKHPWMVLDQFFQMYHLPQARIYLKEWLNDALRAEDSCAPSHITMYDQVEKLIEAAYIFYKSCKSGVDQQHNTEDTHLFQNLVNTETGTGQLLKENQFRRGKPIIGGASGTPGPYAKAIFRLVAPEDLKAALHSWVKVSFSNDSVRYMKAKMKNTLLDFQDDLIRLIEAVYLMAEIKDVLESIGREELPLGLKENLRKDRSFAHLTEAQIDNPELVLAAFFEKFNPEYCEAMLWCFLDSTITYKEQLSDESHKANLLLYYECYLSVIEAAWVINSNRRQEEPGDVTDLETTQE
jgi:hypothetical protein